MICNCEHWQQCPTCMPHRFDAAGKLKPPALTPLQTCHAELAALSAELERETMRLTACGVVAMSDTPESAAKARSMHPDYKRASCDDVARRVDECIALRAKLAAQAEPVALFLLHCGKIDSDGEQDQWETEADSYRRVDEFALQHPGKTVKLYTSPQPARRPLTDAQITEIWESEPRWHYPPIGATDREFARAVERAHGIGDAK